MKKRGEYNHGAGPTIASAFGISEERSKELQDISSVIAMKGYRYKTQYLEDCILAANDAEELALLVSGVVYARTAASRLLM